MKRLNHRSNNATAFGRLCCAAIVLCYLLSFSTGSPVIAQKSGDDKPWQELVSVEGRFRVLLPETPDERFVPVTGQMVDTEMHAYFVRTSVASYVVIYADFPNLSTDPDMLKQAFDSGRERALSGGAVRLSSDKDISAANMPGRELVFDDSANVVTDRMYFVDGRLYQVMFLRPDLRGMPDGMVKFYEGLSTKFFSSFKTETASRKRR
ncbi:MAG: hypothetical protein ABR607_07830 [Pyrinomonadaceae bacterium]